MYIENSILNMLLATFAGFFFLMGASLLVRVRTLPIAYRILGISFLVLAYNLFVIHVMFSGLVRTYPHMFRIGAPTLYLLGPLHFLFVQYLIYPYTKWKKWYYLFFIPALAVLVDMIPVYALPTAEKLKLVEAFYTESMETMKVGSVHFRTHTILRSAIILLFNAGVLVILKPLILKRRHLIYARNKLLLFWVLIGTGLNILSFLTIFFSYLFYNYVPASVIKSGYFIFCVDNLFNAFFLLFNPSFLQGVQWGAVPIIEAEQEDGMPSTSSGDGADVNVKPTPSQLDKPDLLHQLDHYLQFEQPYLNDRLTIEMIAEHLEVKAYKISKEIKNFYGISFADLINSYRLNFIDEKMRSDERWKSYSIESMAYQAGFGSRAAFYVAFRKLRKEQPKSYYGLK